MGDDAGRAVPMLRLAWAFPTVFLCLLLPARVAVAVQLGNGVAGAVMAAALFALPVLYTVRRGRAIWDRYPGRLLAVQAVLTYLPFVMFGQSWAVGLSGLLGGLLLLTLPLRASWVLFAAVVATEGVLRIGVLGIYPEGGAQYVSWVFVVPLAIALPLFGLVRLSDLVADLRTARAELVGLAVTQERLRTAARLRAAVGDRLDTVAVRAAAALEVLRRGPEQARAYLAEAARIARRAGEQVRQTVAEDEPPHGRPTPRLTGNTVAPRLAMLVLVADMSAVAGHHLVIVADEFAGAPAKAAGVAAIIAIVALQLYHSLAGRAGTRPRAWRVTLAVQVLLPFAAIAATFEDRGSSLVGMLGFPAGSALLLVGRRAWLAFAVVVAGAGVPRALLYPEDIYVSLYFMGLVASTGLAVYGLSSLTALAEELEATRREVARAAVDRERLRVAQDAHDLLGLGLSAVALKCDLAGRLIGRDDGRARLEIDALVRLAEQTGVEIRAVTSGGHGMSLRAELAAAREVLASAGADVEIRAGALARSLPEEADGVLATVLREAVTNVLRHAAVTRCEIELTWDGSAVCLRVTNDGVAGELPEPAGERQPERRVGGHGLANLDSRAVALGGRVATRTGGGHFELAVRLPLPAEPSVSAVRPADASS